MKKLFALLICILLLFALVACGGEPCSHRDADDNSLCDKCGESYTDGKDVDDSTPCSHRDADDNSLCDKCGESYTDGKDVDDSTPCSHRDADDNSLCDKCGESYTDGKDLPDEHTHSYTVKNTDSKYLDKEADCENAATYYYSCSCGSKGTTTFVSGEAKGHSFVIENVDIKYQHTPANEYSPAIYYKSCACGKASTTETFTHGDSLKGYLTYELSLDSSYYVVTGFVGAKASISVPNLHDGLPVFAVSANAFKDNPTIKSITMPNSIRSIGSYAFAGCTSLESIIIPTSVTNIADHTFSGCTALKTITLHSGIDTLGTFAFEKCSALKSITLNEGLETISDNAFDYCTALESISIPDTVTSLGNMAFRHAEALRSVKFSSSLESIGNATFQYCVSLRSVELHENINTLGSSTFSYCDGLKSIRILGDLESIGLSTFYECRSLTSIYFASTTPGDCGNTNYIFYNAGIEGDGITLTIAKDAVVPDGFFTPYVEDNMPKITKIVIEDGNTTVGGFKNYNKLPYLVSITYPASITDSAYGAFNNSLWWNNQEIGEVFINGIFYGYKCHCKLATPEDAVTENYVDSKCTEDGGYDTVIYCEVCDDELKRTHTVIPEKGHSPKTAVEENRVEATCTEDGHYDSVVYCNRCNGEVSRTTETIEKLGHNHSEEWTVDLKPTCTEKGSKSNHCTRCGDKANVTEIAANGHSFGEWYEIEAPDCINTGTEEHECSVCHFKDTKTVAALGHNHSEEWTVDLKPTCTEKGSKSNHCTRCGDKANVTEIAANGHSFGEWYEIEAPDCINTGTEEHECSVCHFKETQVISELGHSPKTAVEENRVEATCTEDGHYDSVVYCNRCDDELSRQTVIIPAAHKYINGTCTECGKIVYTRDGNYIYFGEYPQTLKADGVTITSTTDSRGYYLGSDGFYYAKVIADPYNSGYTFSTGASVTDGTTYYFKVEPIRWRILTEDGETAFILCDSIIANHRYDGSSNNYANSEIRQWLNATFYETAFSELQRELILTTTVDNSVYSTGYSSNPYACENTNDKIFLLSYREATNSAYGFSSDYSSYDTARRMQTSDYSRASGVCMSTSSSYYGNGWWWLRSPNSNDSGSARYVCSDGRVGSLGDVSDSSNVVVPALRIRL